MEIYHHHCVPCKIDWSAEHPTSSCPGCSKENTVDYIEPDEDKIMKNAMDMGSPLSVDVADAEAHIAVGIAGVTKIITKIELQRLHLQEASKKIISESKIINSIENSSC